MADKLTTEKRSLLMSKVRSTGNRSTEGRVEEALRARGIRGWTKHPRTIFGRPDFYFSKARVAVFVDGCFWHSCPRCCRLPTSNAKYWEAKIDYNRRRDNRIRARLRAEGFSVIRIWEHEIKHQSWLKRLKRIIKLRNG